jgi:hypothetical protein
VTKPPLPSSIISVWRNCIVTKPPSPYVWQYIIIKVTDHSLQIFTQVRHCKPSFIRWLMVHLTRQKYKFDHWPIKSFPRHSRACNDIIMLSAATCFCIMLPPFSVGEQNSKRRPFAPTLMGINMEMQVGQTLLYVELMLGTCSTCVCIVWHMWNWCYVRALHVCA